MTKTKHHPALKVLTDGVLASLRAAACEGETFTEEPEPWFKEAARIKYVSAASTRNREAYGMSDTQMRLELEFPRFGREDRPPTGATLTCSECINTGHRGLGARRYAVKFTLAGDVVTFASVNAEGVLKLLREHEANLEREYQAGISRGNVEAANKPELDRLIAVHESLKRSQGDRFTGYEGVQSSKVIVGSFQVKVDVTHQFNGTPALIEAALRLAAEFRDKLEELEAKAEAEGAAQ